MAWRDQPWTGVFPATLCAFDEDETIDEAGLRAYFTELAQVEGVQGLTCNGHTGEIMSFLATLDSRSSRAVDGVPYRAVPSVV